MYLITQKGRPDIVNLKQFINFQNQVNLII